MCTLAGTPCINVCVYFHSTIYAGMTKHYSATTVFLWYLYYPYLCGDTLITQILLAATQPEIVFLPSVLLLPLYSFPFPQLHHHWWGLTIPFLCLFPNSWRHNSSLPLICIYWGNYDQRERTESALITWVIPLSDDWEVIVPASD